MKRQGVEPEQTVDAGFGEIDVELPRRAQTKGFAAFAPANLREFFRDGFGPVGRKRGYCGAGRVRACRNARKSRWTVIRRGV